MGFANSFFSSAEIGLLTDGAIPLADLAGLDGATEDAAREQLSGAKAFARRAGISYEQLAELLTTRFVNPEAGLMARSPVLVWRNVTRIKLIQAFRSAYGAPGDALMPGEPLICDGLELPLKHRNKRIDLEARGLIKGAQVIYLGPGRKPGFSRLHVVGAEEPRISAASIVKIEMPDVEEPFIPYAARMGATFLHVDTADQGVSSDGYAKEVGADYAAKAAQLYADQAAEDAHLQRRDADHHGVFPTLGGHFRRDAQHGADGDIRDKHRYRRRQRSNTGFRRQTHGRANGEQHRQVIKNNPARVHHQRQMELIAEGQQQARSGKQ